MKWERVREIHSQAAAALVSTAESIPADAWTLPIAEQKWSPAEIIEHLNCAYDVLQGELDGGKGMAVKTTLWQRVMLRFTIVPRILRGGAFPKGARAPRELRPTNVNPDRAQGLAGFRERSARFDSTAHAMQSQPGTRLTHAYFGRASVAHGVLLCARHIQHHQKQLAALPKP